VGEYGGEALCMSNHNKKNAGTKAKKERRPAKRGPKTKTEQSFTNTNDNKGHPASGEEHNKTNV